MTTNDKDTTYSSNKMDADQLQVVNNAGNSKLDEMIINAKGARGAGVVRVIQDATSSPQIWLFGELLKLSSVQQLSQDPQHEPYYRLLQLFAYGTWDDYIAATGSLPELGYKQIKKLKLLSLINIASVNRLLPYDMLIEKLGYASVRDLENDIIEALYEGILNGRLDQQKQRFEVEWVMGRDISAEGDDIFQLLQRLQNWHNSVGNTLGSIDQMIESMQKAEKQNSEREANLKSLIESKVQNMPTSVLKDNSDKMDIDYTKPDRSKAGRTRKRNRQQSEIATTL